MLRRHKKKHPADFVSHLARIPGAFHFVCAGGVLGRLEHTII